ncbi:unnamed protein product [Cunninghamella blakesleeana]
MFPNEIITNIIQHLSHRYIAQISLVSKQWYSLTRSPLLYKTIRIHNKKQFYNFINITANIAINTYDKPIGYYVKQFIFEEYFQWDAITIKEVDLLFKACPNITYIEGINCPELWSELWENTLHLSKVNYFLQLSDLLLWFTNNTPGWYKMIQHDNNKYTTLEFEIIPDMIRSIDDSSKNYSSYSKGLYIQCQQDSQIRKIKLDEIQKVEDYGRDTTWDNIEIIDGEKYICYYSKIFTFTTSFHYLKHLSIDFGRYSYMRGRKLAHTLELDERTIESIHQVCPLLESLDLREFYMNKSPSLSHQLHHLINKSSAPSTTTARITPCLTLKSLTLTDCFIHHIESFEYFSLKYPNITALSLDLAQSFRITDAKRYELKIGLYKLLSSFSHLTLFSTYFKYWNDFLPITSIKNNWVDKELTSWFIDHPKLFLNLNYDREFDMLTTTEDEDNDDQVEIIKNNKHIYMNHVKELTLKNENNMSEALICLQKLSKLGIHFQYLTILNISNISCMIDKNYFDFYSWLDLLFNLKKLKIENPASDNNIPVKQMTVDLCKRHSQSNEDTTYLLEEIEIINAQLKLNDENNDDATIIMDVPHLELNQFTIKNIFTSANKHIPEYIKRPYELVITESNNKTIDQQQQQSFKIELPSLCGKSQLAIWRVDDILNYDFNQDTSAIYPPIKIELNCNKQVLTQVILDKPLFMIIKKVYGLKKNTLLTERNNYKVSIGSTFIPVTYVRISKTSSRKAYSQYGLKRCFLFNNGIKSNNILINLSQTDLLRSMFYQTCQGYKNVRLMVIQEKDV